MSPADTARLASLDKQRLWHPFTPMSEWCAPEAEPLILVAGQGSMLRDSEGREYIDGNSSIWTNIHGHNHPAINAAIRGQLDKVAHTSFLGFTNPPAIELADALVKIAAPGVLTRVFYADDGSTAIEVAIKLAIQYFQLTSQPHRARFVAFENAYHGDTLGAASLGGIGLFHAQFSRHHFPTEHVASIAALEALPEPATVAAVVIEPLIQGAAGMRPWPAGTLAAARRWCDRHGALLIADEVMTGFGRTGAMFAFQQEEAVPDFLALAKGLSGGYLPLAATLITERIFEAFLGHTFYYGHSFCGNQLGCAAALASLRLFEEEAVLARLEPKILQLAGLLENLRGNPRVREIRQCGLIAGIELDRPAAPACLAARRHGLLTRPILNTVVLMPPLCVTAEELERAVRAIELALGSLT
ncbi:MAG TPA: adenosylmethionine--8-amino-7-oxononanoate transaminase [Chthoniobacteraceae bacterium]|jgi:adenosylmethionine-8-amino-7-oxononanoate aminotransferase|nr:adenosylmethionine--8-amino-7-oxononanoate transaminase [Chthoniobacteraceae bacterium]